MWTIANDGNNVTKKILFVNQTDSIFSIKNGALISHVKTLQRLSFTYTHSADKVTAFSTYPYGFGRQDLNLISSETLVLEASKDNGSTWQVVPDRTVNNTFVHDIIDGLLMKTTIKAPGDNYRVRKYYYVKR